MSAGWLCQHLWEHYAFTGDVDFLKNVAWPLMAGAAEFCLDWLVDDGKGHLVTAPSTSPELDFFTPDGQRAAVTMVATMDMAIIWDLFTNCIEAAAILDHAAAFADQLRDARARLLPYQVGSRGQLQNGQSICGKPNPSTAMCPSILTEGCGDTHRHHLLQFGTHSLYCPT